MAEEVVSHEPVAEGSRAPTPPENAIRPDEADMLEGVGKAPVNDIVAPEQQDPVSPSTVRSPRMRYKVKGGMPRSLSRYLDEGHDELGWAGTRWRQFSLLMKKNGKIMLRSHRATLLQILVPVVFVVLLYLLQFATAQNENLRDSFRSVPSPTPLAIPGVPRCKVGLGKTKCYTLAHVTDQKADSLAVVNKLIADHAIPAAEVRTYASRAASTADLLANPNTTQSVLYLTTNITNDGKKLFTYSIQYNTSSTTERGKLIDQYTYVGQPMQLAVDNAIGYVSGGSDVEINVDQLPFAHPPIVNTNIVSRNGPQFFFGALMFNFVIQIGQIVVEKEFHLREGLNVMGLKDMAYWSSWLVTNIFSNIVSALMLIATGFALQISFFTLNDFGTYFLLFVLFGISMVPLAFLMSNIVSKARTATSLGFAVFLVGVIVQGFARLAFDKDFDPYAQVAFSFLPFVLLAKGVADLANATDGEGDVGLRFADIETNDWFSLSKVYYWMAIDFGVFLVLSWYLDNVLPNEYGIRKPPWFFLTPSYWVEKKFEDGGGSLSSAVDENKSSVQKPQRVGRSASAAAFKRKISAIEALVMDRMDEDVIAERERVKNNDLPSNTGIVIRDLGKSFVRTNFLGLPIRGSEFLAVKNMSVSMQFGELFCLLGHNGAGKTTTISMLIGMLRATHGTADVLGHSITKEMHHIRRVMGVCPQHDVLWELLSGAEHLAMFAALKGMPRSAIKREVEDRLADVQLEDEGDMLVSQYSGGMRRRLSTAIALTADPLVVFLDEPTTGMDPVSRRQVWNLIERAKKDRIVVLTTHSMEESDVLGDQIAIMSHGHISCLGPAIRLKNKFGLGYHITIISREPSAIPRISEFFAAKFSNAVRQELSEKSSTHVDFSIPKEELPLLAEFLELLETQKEDLMIQDLHLSMTTMEEVFLNVSDAEEKHFEAEKAATKGPKPHWWRCWGGSAAVKPA